jgi:hypothetical protein
MQVLHHVKSYLSTEEVTINDYGDVVTNNQGPLGSLIDGGANDGLCGSDVAILEYTLQRCDVVGITQKQCRGFTYRPMCWQDSHNGWGRRNFGFQPVRQQGQWSHNPLVLAASTFSVPSLMMSLGLLEVTNVSSLHVENTFPWP